MIFKKNKQNSGFIAVISLMLISLFSVFGVIYWFSSKSNTEIIMFEGDRIKARNFAMAGVEKVKIHLFNQYKVGNVRPDYIKGKDSRLDSEYNIKFDEGEYQIIKVAPLSTGVGEWHGMSHHGVGRRVIGNYDLWEVISEGKITKTGITAEANVILKVYRDNLIYY